jgi:hypothetical protein
MSSMEIIFTKPCIHCGDTGMVAVPREQVIKYIDRAHAQEAFPDMSIELREQIISGTHPKCWDEMFPMPGEELQQVGSNNE